MPKLIILRGNSGCGKSSTARLLRERLGAQIVWVEQDYLRRIVLKEKEVANGHNIELIRQVADFALSHGQHVVLEGILNSSRYKPMLEGLLAKWPDHYVYYFEVSLEETVRRHASKPNAHEFGVQEITEWFVLHDVLGVEREVIIPESMDQSEIIQRILGETGLTADSTAA